MQYNFGNQLLVIVQQTQKNGTNPQIHTVTVKTLLDYGILVRRSTVKKQINNTVGGQNIVKPPQLIVSNQYGALGQLRKPWVMVRLKISTITL